MKSAIEKWNSYTPEKRQRKLMFGFLSHEYDQGIPSTIIEALCANPIPIESPVDEVRGKDRVANFEE